MEISYEDLSPYAKNVHKLLQHGSEKYSSKKLGGTFYDREKYVIHYGNLKLYLQLGMELLGIHRVLKFRQSTFLKTYIDFCTTQRSRAVSQYKRGIWKLMANSCFGKFIENNRSHTNCIMITDEAHLRRTTASHRYTGMKIISKDFVIAFMKQTKIKSKQAWAIGFTILERSKAFVFDHFYNKMRPRLPEMEVLFTDTDSLCFSVPSTSTESALSKLDDIMDYSNYASTHPMHNKKNASQLGFWKDEMCGVRIEEFVGLRSKTYALRTKNKTQSTCKGVVKGYRKTITFADYKNCLLGVKKFKIRQYAIQSKNHVIRLSSVNKVAFSSFDDKRLLLCAKHSVPYNSIYAHVKCMQCPPNVL